MSGEFKLRITAIKQALDPKQMAKGAFNVFYNNTPIRTGNARSHTVLAQNEIWANYPYATRLDQGYSKQRPKGMSNPTIKWLETYLRNNIGNRHNNQKPGA